MISITTPSLLIARLLLCSHAALAFVNLSIQPSIPQSNKHQQYERPTRTIALHMEVIECDVAIVGGGPAGCACALYTSRAGLSTVILDKNPASGALAITSHIANYPGVDAATTGEALLARMRAQAVASGARYARSQAFRIDVAADDETTGDGTHTKRVHAPDLTVRARALVLAAGAMGRTGRPIPGEQDFLGAGVSYCATCDGAFFRDAEVAVAGASTEAVEEALFLTKFARRVHWLTPVDIAPGSPRHAYFDRALLSRLLACDNVEHWEKTRLLTVRGDASGVTGVAVRRTGGGAEEEEEIAVEGVFVYGAGGGSKPITDFCQAQVDLDESGGVIVDETMSTSCPGVFAIGDIRNGEYKQAVAAASEGCIAAMSIERFLNQREHVQVDWNLQIDV